MYSVSVCWGVCGNESVWMVLSLGAMDVPWRTLPPPEPRNQTTSGMSLRESVLAFPMPYYVPDMGIRSSFPSCHNPGRSPHPHMPRPPQELQERQSSVPVDQTTANGLQDIFTGSIDRHIQLVSNRVPWCRAEARGLGHSLCL